LIPDVRVGRATRSNLLYHSIFSLARIFFVPAWRETSWSSSALLKKGNIKIKKSKLIAV
jgi:hypothetical protein